MSIRVYVVQNGDYPLKITKLLTGDFTKEKELRRVNLTALRANGEWLPLFSGQKLNIPTSWPDHPSLLKQDHVPSPPSPPLSPLSGRARRLAVEPDVTKAFHNADDALSRAWAYLLPTVPLSDPARFLILGQVWFESMFGVFESMTDTNNWGSIMATDGWIKSKGSLPGFGKFSHLDHSYTGKPFTGSYRMFPNQYEAAKDYLEFLKDRAGMITVWLSGFPTTYARALWNIRYYTGTAGTPDDRIAAYAKKVSGGLTLAKAALSRPRPDGPLTAVTQPQQGPT